MTKRVLIITYYWPPFGGAGVFRWLKFVKYLPCYGWKPVVYTPQNPESPLYDETLLSEIPDNVEVIKTPIWEPYSIYKRLTGKRKEKIAVGLVNKSGKKDGFVNKLFLWLRGNLLIPDPKRFWINPSVRFLTKYLAENTVDAIVTTGPPHSMHLIGLKLQKKTGIKWIADFRDPWTNIDFYEQLHLSKLANWVHHKLERKVVQNADVVVTISEQMRKEFLPLIPQKIEVITNGYDTDDLVSENIVLDTCFTITHVGTLTQARNPQNLWQVLGNISKENATFKQLLKIKLVGPVDYSVCQSIEQNNLADNLLLIDHLTHREAIAAQQKSQVLLLVVNDAPNLLGIIPGKFFEYLSTGRPIIGIGPTNGDLAAIFEETGIGNMLEYGDTTGIERAVDSLYSKFVARDLSKSMGNIVKYSRKELTHKMVQILDWL